MVTELMKHPVHLRKEVSAYCNYLMSVTAGGPESP